MTTRPSGLRESLRKQGLKAEGLRGSLRNVGAAGPGIPGSGVSRFTFEDANNDTSILQDVWGANNLAVNGPTYNGTGGDDGNGEFDFNGTGGNYIGETNSISASPPYSVGVWFNPDTTSGDNYILSNLNGNQTGPTISLRSGELAVQFETTGGGPEFGESNFSLTNQWVFILATTDGSTQDVFVNDSAVSDSILNGNANDSNFTLGERAARDGFAFDGQMAEVVIYDKKLSRSEATDLYNTGSI